MPREPSPPVLVGDSPAMRDVRRFLARAAAVDASVLVLGETGTGKSLLARALHSGGVRSGGPFVSINCAALPESIFESELFGHRKGAFTGAAEDRIGLIESAHRGTLLLDEVGDLPLPQQAKLLTVLEEREVRPVGARRPTPVDVRLISAASGALDRWEEGRSFRRDLFHRLSLLQMRMPALRERRDDVPRLAEHFLAAAARRHRLPCPELDGRARGAIDAYAWPGNVRELAHALEAALILGGERGFAAALGTVIGARADGAGAAPPARYSFYGTGDDERARIRAALDRCRGNRTRTAAELGMSRNTLRTRMRRYGL